jgi:hypothetical protein
MLALYSNDNPIPLLVSSFKVSVEKQRLFFLNAPIPLRNVIKILKILRVLGCDRSQENSLKSLIFQGNVSISTFGRIQKKLRSLAWAPRVLT